MFRLAIILSSTLLIKANEIEFDNYLEGNDINHKEVSSAGDLAVISLEPLWVLNLNNDDLNVRLRAGSDDERNDFEYMAEPMIKRNQRRPRVLSRNKKDKPEKNSDPSSETASESLIVKNDENKQLRREILKLINKFAMSTDKEPDIYLSEIEETDGPTLALYFRGQYSSLIVKQGRKEWHYFINSPSQLPTWFYEEHSNIIKEGQETYIDIPETVKDAFFKSFLHMLQKLLSIPV